MKISLLLSFGLWGIFQSIQAEETGIIQDDILPVFLNIDPGENNKYTADYYHTKLASHSDPTNTFFCHIALSLRLAGGNIPKATQELIEAKTSFFNHDKLENYLHHLQLAEGILYTHLGKYERAAHLLEQAITGFEHLENPILMEVAKLSYVNTLSNWGRFDQGYLLMEELLQNRSYDLFQTREQYNRFEMALWNRKATLMTALTSVRGDSLNATRNILEFVIALARERKDEYAYYNNTGNLAYLHFLNREYEKMIPLALEDLGYSERRNNVESIGGLHTILADAYFNLNLKDSARYHLKKAEYYSKNLRNKFFHEVFVEVARQYYQQSGNLEEAFQSLNAQYAAINSIYKSIDQINFELSNAENSLSQAEERIERLDLKNRQNIIINWLLGLLVLSIGLLAIIFYRMHRNQRRFRSELERINQNLENEIERRTKEVVEQSEKIKAAAYHNSHRTRAPVARLLGLVDILNTEISSEREEIAEYIRQSAKEIDEVIIDMNEVLSNRPDK